MESLRREVENLGKTLEACQRDTLAWKNAFTESERRSVLFWQENDHLRRLCDEKSNTIDNLNQDLSQLRAEMKEVQATYQHELNCKEEELAELMKMTGS